METPNAQRAVTPLEEGPGASGTTASTSPKKRRKVNHGKERNTKKQPGCRSLASESCADTPTYEQHVSTAGVR